jgi:hypothetical protein
LQPDTLIPGVDSPQSWNRFSYVQNRPVHFNDPTGHREACGEQGVICEKKPYTLGQLISQDVSSSGSLGTNKTRSEVEEYLKTHPSYDPSEDPYLRGVALNAFQHMRSDYWANRARDAGICAFCAGESWKLTQYYDYHEKVILTGWDSSKVNWHNVALDSLSTGLSVVALNEVSAALRISKPIQNWATILGSSRSVVTGGEAFANGDAPGVALSGASLIPGPPGTIASGASVFFDLNRGFYNYEWQPTIPR